MALLEIVQNIQAPEVIEGTPDEIAERLKTLNGGKRLTLIIPGDDIRAKEETIPQTPKAPRSLREIFAESQQGFDNTSLSDDELSELIESEVKAYRIEQRSKDANGS